MALMYCQFFSDTLGMMSKMVAIIPQAVQRQIGVSSVEHRQSDGYPVLYLLHGLSDDETVWTRRTSIERYAQEKGIAVVMPCTHRSFYTDAVHGYRYFKHVAEEVPALARSFFHLSAKREDNFIAGLSMGGYGALKIATTFPDRFCAAASLSGVVDIAARFDGVMAPEVVREMEMIFGPLDQIKDGVNDLFSLTQKMASSNQPKTKIYQCCGTEDFLYAMNVRYRDMVKSLSLDFTYEEGPGTHNWAYWDVMIQRVLEWLPLNKSSVL